MQAISIVQKRTNSAT